MEYAQALPKLIKDNIGDAPLTVRIYVPLNLNLAHCLNSRFGPRPYSGRFRLLRTYRTINLPGSLSMSSMLAFVTE